MRSTLERSLKSDFSANPVRRKHFFHVYCCTFRADQRREESKQCLEVKNQAFFKPLHPDVRQGPELQGSLLLALSIFTVCMKFQ